jgi:HTH-type transcriptional regulator/antitoxin HigA
MTQVKRHPPVPDWAVIPGEVLVETLEERGWKQTRLADAMDVSASYISDLCHGRRAITAHVALQLEAALGVRATFWMGLQTNYDLHVERAKIANARR